MKSIRAAIPAAVVVLSAVSCSKERETAAAYGIRVQLPVNVEQKTALSAPDEQGSYSLFWKDGDRISVNGMVSEGLSGQSGTGTEADFHFPQAPSAASVYNFLYPGTVSEDVVIFPSVQNYVEGSPDGAAMPMYAALGDIGAPVALNNLAAVLRFSFTGTVALDRIVLRANGAEMLSGTFTVGKTEGRLDGSLTVRDGVDSVVLDCNSLRLGQTAADFFVAIPGRNYSAGIEARVYDTAGGAMRLSFWGGGKSVQADKVYRFEAKEFTPYYAWVIADDGSMTAQDVTLDRTVKIKACTFNIWTPSARSGNAQGEDYGQLQWGKAYKAVANCIIANDPDVIGLNEVSYDAYLSTAGSNLRNQLPDYSWVIFASQYWPATRPDDIVNPSSNMGVCNAILYKTADYTLVSSSGCWISTADKNRGANCSYVVPSSDTLYTGHRYNDSFEAVSGGKYAAYTSTRMICCALLRHNASGKVFWVFSAHQDLTSFNGPATEQVPSGYRTIKDAASQCTNSRSIICHARRLCPEGTASIILGDMNTSNSTSYNYYLTSGSWYSSYDADPNWAARLLTPTPGRWSDCYEVVSRREGTFTTAASISLGTMNGKDNHSYSSARMDHILVDGFNVISYSVDRNKYKNSDNYLIFPSDHFLVKTVLAF